MKYVDYLVYILTFGIAIAIIMFNQKIGNNAKRGTKHDRSARNGYMLSLLSIVLWLVPIFGLPVTIIGIILNVRGLKSELIANRAKIGLVLSSIFLIATIVNMALVIILK